MLSMRTAATLLGAATTLDGLAALLRATRLMDGPLAPIPSETADALGLAHLGTTWMAGSLGAVRALLCDVGDGPDLRTAVERITRPLATRSAHVRWIVAVRNGHRSAIVAWRSGTTRRLVALAWEPSRPMDSDAETICALHAAFVEDDELLHARVVEILGRDTLTRRFYRALEARVTALACHVPSRSTEDARAVTLLHVSRLLFLCFIEAKGWLDGDRAFLSHRFDSCMASGGGFHRRVLLPLFFGTLNTPARRRSPAARAFGRVPFLNGGLFARAAVERGRGRWSFPDEEMGALFADVFLRHRFVAREDSATWSEASIDPEMLGRAFESLMSSGDRKSGGVFFTPHHLVERVAGEGFGALSARDGASLRRVRLLDPACGSGAFLVHALERLADARRAAGEPGTLDAIRRDVLARSIFGVDRDPTAVWMCELRLWLSVVIELDEQDPLRVPPLPNLDRNVRVGDALAGEGFDDRVVPGSGFIAHLRSRYLRAVGTRKSALARALDREERRRSLARLDAELATLRHARKEQVLSMRARNLFGERTGIPDKKETRRLRGRLRVAAAERKRVAEGGALPFSFAALFAEAQADGGFDLVLGNPPWVRLHRIPEALRTQFRASFQVFRDAPWRSGAASARAGAGFASQVDLSALFVERSLRLLRPGGALALLVPVKLWQSLSGGGVRRLLLQDARLVRIENLGSDEAAFDAAVYPSLVVARAESGVGATVTVARDGAGGAKEWRVAPDALSLDASPGAPWLILSPSERTGFDRLRSVGIPLASRFGAPRLGVKSGCNAAFIVRIVAGMRTVAVVQDANGERGKVEAALLRPVLRGDSVSPWRRNDAEECIIWTHDARGPLAQLPPNARAWLGRHHGSLASRADASRSRRWWSLFRVDAASNGTARLVWADFGRRPRALVLAPGDAAVPLNTCYVVPTPNEADAWALAAVLNSRIGGAWLNAIAEPARGGYRRYLGWTVGHLPIPRDWDAARGDLMAAALRCADGAMSEDGLDDVVRSAYGVSHRCLGGLLAACDR